MSAPSYVSSKWTIPAGGVLKVNRTAEFLTCLDATAGFRIRLENAPETDFEKGLTFNSDVTFNTVDLINPNTFEIEVTLGFGRGNIRDSRFVVAGAVNTRERLLLRPFVTDPSGIMNGGGSNKFSINTLMIGTNLMEIMPEDPIRQKAIVQNMGGETLAVHVASSSTYVDWKGHNPDPNGLYPGYAAIASLNPGDKAHIEGFSSVHAYFATSNGSYNGFVGLHEVVHV